MSLSNDEMYLVVNKQARTASVLVSKANILLVVGTLNVSPVREDEDEVTYRLSDILLAIVKKLADMEATLADIEKTVEETRESIPRELREAAERAVAAANFVVPSI